MVYITIFYCMWIVVRMRSGWWDHCGPHINFVTFFVTKCYKFRTFS